MKLIDYFYNSLPFFFQNIAISIYGYQWKKRRFGGVYHQELNNFKQREFYTKEQWQEYQLTELKKLLIHAMENVPYYDEKFSKNNLDKSSIRNFKLADLGILPFLKKSDLREFGESRLLSKGITKQGSFLSSSGSTGTPTKIFVSNEMHQKWSAAFEVRIRNWAGLCIKNPRGMIGGRRIVQDGNSNGPFYRYNLFEKQVYFSAYHISPVTVDNYVKGMLKYNIDYMTGYAMSNYILARFIKEKGLKVPSLKAVITSSEKLTKEMRDLFLEVYGCKTFDSYSGVEACGLISECEYGNLHISPDVGIIEIIKDDGTYAKPGEIGEAVCTGFLNYDQPLIRYKIGDLIKLSKNQFCQCGRNMQVVEEILGRVEDTVVGKDGREMVRFHGIFINIPNIIEGQIIQHSLTNFELVVVSSMALTQTEKKELQKRMESQLGDISLKITEVENIPRNTNGKFKAVISLLKK